jgi:hypothetical protein
VQLNSERTVTYINSMCGGIYTAPERLFLASGQRVKPADRVPIGLVWNLPDGSLAGSTVDTDGAWTARARRRVQWLTLSEQNDACDEDGDSVPTMATIFSSDEWSA